MREIFIRRGTLGRGRGMSRGILRSMGATSLRMRTWLRFMGLRGILSSTGKFGGTPGEIAVEGSAEVPAFRLDLSDHALPLHAEFQAVVDGTTGDTTLEEVRARVGRSDVDGAWCGNAIDDGSRGTIWICMW